MKTCPICGKKFAHPWRIGRHRATCGNPKCQHEYKRRYNRAYNKLHRTNAIKRYNRKADTEFTNDANMENAIYC